MTDPFADAAPAFDDPDAAIDAFVERTGAAVGEPVVEGAPWATGAGADQVRLFNRGLGDANPRWDPDAPGDEVHPTYLFAVRYPQLHGAPMAVPLSSFVGGIRLEWDATLRVGDLLSAEAAVADVTHKRRNDRRYVVIDSEVAYRRDGERVATAEATLVRISEPTGDESDGPDPDDAAVADDPVADAGIPAYGDAALADLAAAYDEELSRLADGPLPTPDPADVEPGDALPGLVRGPLTVGDMVAWQAGATPTYGAGPFNYRRAREAPHAVVVNERTGWPHAAAQRHDDPWLARQRGLARPFANGDMMTAWAAPLVTHWMGADGRLLAHGATLRAPFLYGDVLRIDGTVRDVAAAEGWEQAPADAVAVTVDWRAVNQRDEVSYEGESVVALPG